MYAQYIPKINVKLTMAIMHLSPDSPPNTNYQNLDCYHIQVT